MITIAEFSAYKKFKYNSGMLLARKRKNKRDVCKVLRVDKEKK
jgi:translation initiation factor 2 alpha subunit (eIF-2alpha)